MQANIKLIQKSDRDWVKDLIIKEWGSEKIIAKGKVYYPDKVEGFIFWENKERKGLLTYIIEDNGLEILTLNALEKNKGIGTKFIQKAIQAAKKLDLKRVWCTTTNDNLDAIRFYKKNRFKIVRIYPNAVQEARKIKPEIPLVGFYGLPIRDEIEIERIILNDWCN